MRDIKPRILSRVFLSGLIVGSFCGQASKGQAQVATFQETPFQGAQVQIFQPQEAKSIKKTIPAPKAFKENSGKRCDADRPIIPRELEIRLDGSFSPVNLFRFLPLDGQKADGNCQEKCCPQEVVKEQDPFLPDAVPEIVRQDLVRPAKLGPVHLDIQLTRGTESELQKLKAEIAQLQAEIAKLKAVHQKMGTPESPQKKAMIKTEGHDHRSVGVGRVDVAAGGHSPTQFYAIRVEDGQKHPQKTGSNQNPLTTVQVVPVSANPHRLSPKALENLLEVLKDVPPATRTKVLEMVFGGQGAPLPVPPYYSVPLTPQAMPYSQALPYPQGIPPQQTNLHAPFPPIPPSPDLANPVTQPFASVRTPQPVPVTAPWAAPQTQPVPVLPNPNSNHPTGRNSDQRGPTPPPPVSQSLMPSAGMIPPTMPAPPVPMPVAEQRVPSPSAANDQKLNRILEKLERLENRLDAQERRSQPALPPRGEPSYKPVTPPLAQPIPAVTPN